MALTVLNPATELPIAELQQAGVEETDAAIARARAAYPAWRSVAPSDRARLLRRLATLVEDHHEELSQIESQNVGKPISGARGEIGMVAQVFHFYAGAIDKHYGETIPVAGGVALTFREPLGVVGLITPWNFPLNIASWKLGPALACGNTVVLKPAELTPLSALRLAELALDAGIPEGVLNVLVGKGSVVGQRLIEHPDLAKIGFTGSTEVGQLVMAGAAATVKRVTLELGGKSANVIFADADLEKAAASAPYSVFDNAGQDCCARSRILVERSVYDRFVSLLIDATRGLKVGAPRDDATDKRRSRRPRGGVRPRCCCDPVQRRGRRHPHRERHSVRPFRLDLDTRRRAGTPRRPSARHRRPEHQLELVGPRVDAVRRLQAVGLRPRTRHARAAELHGSQERLHLHGGLTAK